MSGERVDGGGECRDEISPGVRSVLHEGTGDLGGEDMLPRVLDLVTTNAARAIGSADGYGIQPGAVADLVVLDTFEYAEAVIGLPPRTWVIKSGQVTFSSVASTLVSGLKP